MFPTLTDKPVGPDRLTRLFSTTGPYRRIRRWSRTRVPPRCTGLARCELPDGFLTAPNGQWPVRHRTGHCPFC